MTAITQEKVAAAYQRANSFLGACLAREDIWSVTGGRRLVMEYRPHTSVDRHSVK